MGKRFIQKQERLIEFNVKRVQKIHYMVSHIATFKKLPLKFGFLFFVFPFVWVVNHTDWSACVEPALGTWDESHLVMVYEFFYIAGYSLLRNLLRIYAPIFKDIGPQFSFLAVSLSGFDIRLTVASENLFRSVPSSSQFFGRIWQHDIYNAS